MAGEATELLGAKVLKSFERCTASLVLVLGQTLRRASQALPSPAQQGPLV